jgi:alkylation response protein AidB-like acyl-CoA dehydrogenase
MRQIGAFRLRTPRRYGGLECDALTALDVVSELARGDASASWVVGVNLITTSMACMLQDQAQDEIFADPEVRLCGTLSPTGMCTLAKDGLLLNGRWGFISGALHAQWQMIVAMAPAPAGGLWPILAAVPLADLTIVDDWYSSGLRGSGSITTIADNVFIPDHRVLPLPLVLNEQYASARNAGSAVYAAPLLPLASALSVGTAVGIARSALELFLDRLPGRKITYTSYDHQNQAPLTHLQVARATMLVDEVKFHAQRLAWTIDARCADFRPWTLSERARARADMGRTCELAQEAVDLLARASGGTSIYQNVPAQRLLRDIQAINLHALMHPDTNAELYGRVLCGLEPNTLYI